MHLSMWSSNIAYWQVYFETNDQGTAHAQHPPQDLMGSRVETSFGTATLPRVYRLIRSSLAFLGVCLYGLALQARWAG